MMRPWSREELEHEVIIRHRDGWSRRGIGRALHVSRNTVRDIIAKVEQQRQAGHDILEKKQRAPRASTLDAYEHRIKEVLEKYAHATGQRVFEILRDEGYRGGISILRERIAKLRPKPKREPIVRFETEPGQQGQMDWSPYRLKLRGGDILKVLCFSYVLGFSRRQYIDFVRRRDFFTLIRRHQDAFAHFSGVPRQCLYDSEKTVVLRWEANRPVFNPAFLQFSTHYGCKPIACTRGRPQTKGKVEEPFQYIEGNLLNARTFTDLDDLRTTARWWLANRSDTHIHDTTNRAPLELFLAEEAQVLQPLPAHAYDSSEIRFLVGRLDGFVDWKTNIYSFPYDHVGEILTVRATDTEISVYTPELELIAHHERIPDASHQKSEQSAHRVRSKKVRYGLEPVRQTFGELGTAAGAFLAGLQQRHPRNCGFHARQILLMKEAFHSDDIHAALVHAMRYHAYDCLAVERIVKARARPRTLEQTMTDNASLSLRGVLPPIRQRPLAEYQDLLDHPASEDHEPQETGDDTDESAPRPTTDQDP